MNMKAWLPLLLSIALLTVSLAPAAGPTVASYVCVPGTPTVATYPAEITVSGTEKLIGKFYYPRPDVPSGGDFDPGTLPGVLLTHGFGQTYADVEAQAAELAENCMVALAFNYFGQGWDWEITTQYDMLTTAERDALTYIVNELKAGPIKNQLDLVDDSRLGMMGFSQGGTYTWAALADPNQRAKFQAVAVYSELPFLSGVLLPNGCLNANLANVVDPDRARTPTWTPGAATPTGTFPAPVAGAVWAPTTYASLYNAYLTPDVPVWQTALAARDFPVTQLAQTSTPGAPHPHTYIQAGWYDAFQMADSALTPWATLTTATPVNTPTSAAGQPTPTPLPPFHRLYVGRGGHADDPWQGNLAVRASLGLLKIGWLRSQLEATPVASATPTQTPNGGGAATATPTPTPYPVEYVVDAYTTPGTPFGTVVFDTRQSSVWPPAEVQSATPWTFYLHKAGTAKTVTPESGLLQQVAVAQTKVAGSGYNLGTAVAEDPKFDTWATALAPQPQEFVSAVLDQDVTLYGPPSVQLFTNAPAGGGLAQVHVRILERDPATGHKMFVARANTCNWSTSATRGDFFGTPYPGEPRFHTFKAGRQIVFEVTTVDAEVYRPSRSLMYITPYLASFSLNVRVGRNGENTNVTLPLLPSNPNAPVFRADGAALPARDRRSPALGPAASPDPLTIRAWLYPEFTNPGGWRAWASQLSFECAGGEGAVTCPEDRLLWGDGADQSFTFEARDAAGHVATVTLSGLNVDRTPPGFAHGLPATRTFCSGARLPLAFSVTDATSGLARSQATFNGQAVQSGQSALLRAGPNALLVTAEDVAGNGAAHRATVRVNYAATLDLPAAGQAIDRGRPLHFGFAVADACAAGGQYGGAEGTLWLTGPDGAERPAEWAGAATGNAFAYDDVTGGYAFEADVSGLAAGTWTARVHLDDGNDYTTTFVVP